MSEIGLAAAMEASAAALIVASFAG